jgi:dTDP-4-amino-4,6-dideoxygalactose transaminase
LADYFRTKVNAAELPLRVQQEHAGGRSAYHLFVIKLQKAALRDKLMASLQERGVQTLVHYPHPIYRQPAFLKFTRNPNPACEELCASILSLPFHQYLRAKEIDYIVETIQVFFRNQ